jgi:hypothetical protein
MLQMFSKYAGVIQGVLGAVGTASPSIGASLGTAQGGSIFNLISGAALSYLGFQGNEGQQKMGAIGIGGVNAVVGLLSAFGVHTIGGVTLTEGTIGTIINLAVGAWGLVAGLKKKAA